MGRRSRYAVVFLLACTIGTMVAAPAAAAPLRPLASDRPTTDVGRVPTGGEVALDADPVPTTVVPFQATGYRYLVVAAGGGAADFMQPGFNDAAFNTGQAGFGSGGGCSVQGTRHTTWPTNTDILIRKTIDLPPNTTDVTITGGIDNDLFIYWNGELLGQRFHEGCPTPTDFTVPVPQTGVVSGANVLAVRARDRGVESWVDLSVTATLHPLTTPAADAGPDQGVVEGAIVQLDGSHSTDPSNAPLTYSWALGTPRRAADHAVVVDEPPSRRSRASMTGLRVHPHRQRRHGDATRTGRRHRDERETGPVGPGRSGLRRRASRSSRRRFTDAGILDTHHGVVDWGDGSGPQTVPVDAQGTGWGTLVASHVYAHAGSFTVTITSPTTTAAPRRRR